MSELTQYPLLTTVYGSVEGSGKTVYEVVNAEVNLTFKYFQSMNRERVRKVNTVANWDLYDWMLSAGGNIRVVSHTLKELSRTDGNLNLSPNVSYDLWDRFEKNLIDSTICLFSLVDNTDWCMERAIIKRFNRVAKKHSILERLPVKQAGVEIDLTFKDFQLINRERVRKFDPKTAWDQTHWMIAALHKFQRASNVFMGLINITANSASDSRLIADQWDIFEENLIDTVMYLFSLADNTGIDIQTSIIKRFNTIIENHGFTELLLYGNQKIGKT